MIQAGMNNGRIDLAGMDYDMAGAGDIHPPRHGVVIDRQVVVRTVVIVHEFLLDSGQ